MNDQNSLEHPRLEPKPPHNVIMPETIEEPALNVDGLKEYHRSAYSMIAVGILLILSVIATLFFIGRFFFVILFCALYLIGLGVKHLSKSSKE